MYPGRVYRLSAHVSQTMLIENSISRFNRTDPAGSTKPMKTFYTKMSQTRNRHNNYRPQLLRAQPSKITRVGHRRSKEDFVGIGNLSICGPLLPLSANHAYNSDMKYAAWRCSNLTCRNVSSILPGPALTSPNYLANVDSP